MMTTHHAAITAAIPKVRRAVIAVCRKMKGANMDECVSVGLLAVCENVHRFDAKRGFDFDTFAATVAKNAARRFLGMRSAHVKRCRRIEPLDERTTGLVYQGQDGGVSLDRDGCEVERRELAVYASASPEDILIARETELELEAVLARLTDADRAALLRDGPAPKGGGRGSIIARRELASAVLATVYGSTPEGRPAGPLTGVERSRRWYANMSDEKKAARLAARRDRDAARRAARAA